ncbi:MAG: hypothetical protein CSA34_03565 [Desulfobulbus propionicus]|nr:MAG: hypothetical protein CSA34_03565 [Desulfobulbus propionicus]
MADQKIHLIITGERGTSRALTIKKNTVYRSVLFGVIITLGAIVGLSSALRYYQANLRLNQRVADLARQMHTERLALQTQLEASHTQFQAERHEKNRLVAEYQEEIAQLMEEQETKILSSISRLDERAKVIESVMDTIGVELKVDTDENHSGGPFIAAEPFLGERLIQETEQYLDFLEKMPLGRPVPGTVSSGFGKRHDPFNHCPAFHSGIDFRGKTGTPVRVTGNGRVRISSYNKSFGNYVVIRHDNGYQTVYGHLYKRLVKRGQQVKRGQEIGLLGNSGRSTGSHLHYEVRLNGKAINPAKLINVANLSLKLSK